MGRNRTNFPSKGKDGICRVLSCVHVGKHFMRLDCHLNRCHKGITRAMNERLAMPSWEKQNSDRNGSKCMLHSCKKQVKHLERHLCNVHGMTYATYLEETKYHDPVTPTEQNFSPKKLVRLSKLIESSSNFTHQNDLIVRGTPEWKYKDKTEAKKESVKCSGSESVQSASVLDVHLVARDLNRSFDSEENESLEWLRFLVHNTNSYSLRSLLIYLKQHPSRSINDYYHTKLREDVFGTISLSFLKNVYVKRHKLLSYYKRLGYFPNEGGRRVGTCLACGKKGGKCDCPKISQSFYVYCRYHCPLKFGCNKCKKTSAKKNFHDCFDFFFCKTCDEYYRITKMSSSCLSLWKGMWGC